MTEYSEAEKDQILREYWGDDEEPRCPRCGEIVRFDRGRHSDGGPLRMHVNCDDCCCSFSWQQPVEVWPWKSVQLQYFVERYRAGEAIRCPRDDCNIAYTEFSDKIIEFRCPYCNGRGRADLNPELPILD